MRRVMAARVTQQSPGRNDSSNSGGDGDDKDESVREERRRGLEMQTNAGSGQDCS